MMLFSSRLLPNNSENGKNALRDAGDSKKSHVLV